LQSTDSNHLNHELVELVGAIPRFGLVTTDLIAPNQSLSNFAPPRLAAVPCAKYLMAGSIPNGCTLRAKG
jgi:hypothetical protein